MVDEESKIIDLHTRTEYRPDMAALARSHVAAARHKMGLSPSEFAEVLKPLLPNQPLTTGLIENWETAAVPPGDVLIAAGLVAKAGPLRAEDDPSHDVVRHITGNRFADVAAVFASRSEFSSRLPTQDLFAGAARIDAVGLSLNVLCQQYADDQLRDLIEGGTRLRCLFLAPGCGAILAREREEGHVAGHLSALTEVNIQILTERVRNRLSDEAKPRLLIATYEETIRFNIMCIDQRVAVVQPYLPTHRGVESPTFLLRRRPRGTGLFPVFEHVFDSMLERSTPR